MALYKLIQNLILLMFNIAMLVYYNAIQSYILISIQAANAYKERMYTEPDNNNAIISGSIFII